MEVIKREYRKVWLIRKDIDGLVAAMLSYKARFYQANFSKIYYLRKSVRQCEWKRKLVCHHLEYCFRVHCSLYIHFIIGSQVIRIIRTVVAVVGVSCSVISSIYRAYKLLIWANFQISICSLTPFRNGGDLADKNMRKERNWYRLEKFMGLSQFKLTKLSQFLVVNLKHLRI